MECISSEYILPSFTSEQELIKLRIDAGVELDDNDLKILKTELLGKFLESDTKNMKNYLKIKYQYDISDNNLDKLLNVNI